MATDLKFKLRYHHRLFLLLTVFLWSLVACCIVFQYVREKQFKVERLDAGLQVLNRSILGGWESGRTNLEGMYLPDSLRVTIINRAGKVLFDNSLSDGAATNHLNRPEVVMALELGHGYTIERRSESNNIDYFYSALKGDEVIVRTALPYTTALVGQLKPDRAFLYLMGALALIFSILGYVATKRLGNAITRLNNYAERAEKGERIFADESFPRDELGSISGHIIRLYARLQQALIDREAEQRAALHEEQEKIRIKKQLTNNINHELKTPVAAIQVCLETLEAHPDLSEDKRNEFIRRCSENAERLNSLLGDVSTITRLDDGAQKIAMERVSVSRIINEVVEEEGESLKAAGFKIDVAVPQGVVLQGNAPLLASLFRNLINNAVSYSGGNEIVIRLEDEAASGNGGAKQYTFSFADNGVGVAPEHLDHLFERFYRVDSGRSRKLGGTGLGLAIVKNVVLLHGGKIDVSNRPSGGLYFLFTLI